MCKGGEGDVGEFPKTYDRGSRSIDPKKMFNLRVLNSIGWISKITSVLFCYLDNGLAAKNIDILSLY